MEGFGTEIDIDEEWTRVNASRREWITLFDTSMNIRISCACTAPYISEIGKDQHSWIASTINKGSFDHE